jgi:prepilin signal peptidase PulO-like enzyme (type II secretory pathway)
MVGPLPVIFVVFLLGSIIGSVVGLLYLLVRRRNGMLPFGPSLVLAAILYVLYGDVLTRALVPGVGLALGWT